VGFNRLRKFLKSKVSAERIKQMGYIQTLAVINAILLTAVLLWIGVSTAFSILSGLIFGTVLCLYGGQRHKRIR